MGGGGVHKIDTAEASSSTRRRTPSKVQIFKSVLGRGKFAGVISPSVLLKNKRENWGYYIYSRNAAFGCNTLVPY